MKEGPSIAPIAALAGDPARANILAALLAGKALTAGELAREAGVALSTASAHLAKLSRGGLVSGVRQGRHRYFELAGRDVAEMLETMMGVAARAGFSRTRTGPSEPLMRKARVCYDHLAGEMGVALLDALMRQKLLARGPEGLRLTAKGAAFMEGIGIDVAALAAARRPLCKDCLDWSQRRRHLSGALGTALLEEILRRKWAVRARAGRAILFSRAGEARFSRAFAIAGPPPLLRPKDASL